MPPSRKPRQQRFVVVLPLSALTVGDRFAASDWPLHITVLPPFRTDHALSQVAEVIAAVADTQTMITAWAGADTLFGRRRDIPVTLMLENSGLSRLHQRLVDALRPLSARPEESAFRCPEFRAHVTLKGGSRVNSGDRLTLAQLALVEMTPWADASGRAVLATVPLIPPR